MAIAFENVDAAVSRLGIDDNEFQVGIALFEDRDQSLFEEGRLIEAHHYDRNLRPRHSANDGRNRPTLFIQWVEPRCRKTGVERGAPLPGFRLAKFGNKRREHRRVRRRVEYQRLHLAKTASQQAKAEIVGGVHDDGTELLQATVIDQPFHEASVARRPQRRLVERLNGKRSG